MLGSEARFPSSTGPATASTIASAVCGEQGSGEVASCSSSWAKLVAPVVESHTLACLTSSPFEKEKAAKRLLVPPMSATRMRFT
jgi:hypothetical protein